ncbi:hypothetical protein [Mesonia aquimarina]|uniref:hypothetical protein n=1 Tax=Mesonia aquimarina TaxID=1504967 RepID=UPI000EF5EAFC|nr:hypothetical protein [Mesonia aquimarina]
MKNDIKLLVLVLVFPLFTFAQNKIYSAHYKIDIYYTGNDTFKDFISANNSIKNYAVKVITMDRYIWANEDYMKIKMITTSYDKETKKSTQDSTILSIDKNRALVLNEKKNEFFKIKKYELVDNGFLVKVKTKDNESHVFFDNEIPKPIMPFYTEGLGINGGVNVSMGANSIIRLISWEETNKAIDYSQVFSKIKEPETLEEMDFF